MKPPTEEEVRLSFELANEAVAPFRPLLNEAAASAICDAIADELLFTDVGRLKLKAAAPDPRVERSGSLPTSEAKEGEPISSRKKAASRS